MIYSVFSILIPHTPFHYIILLFAKPGKEIVAKFSLTSMCHRSYYVEHRFQFCWKLHYFVKMYIETVTVSMLLWENLIVSIEMNFVVYF